MPGPLTSSVRAPQRAGRSRLAGATPPAARLALGGLAAALLMSIAAASTARTAVSDTLSAATLYAGLADAVRSGGDYYLSAIDAWRHAGRLPNPFAIGLPALTMVAAAMPIWLLTGCLWLLAGVTVLAWDARIVATGVSRSGRVVAWLLLLGGMTGIGRPQAALAHEAWAGLLLALSLGVRRPSRPVATIALGLAAVLIDQAIAPYLLLMACFAWAEARRQEAVGWCLAVAAFGIVFAFHACAVSAATSGGGFGGGVGGGDWLAAVGIGAALRLVGAASILTTAPAVLAAPVVVLALAGWAMRQDPAAARVTATLIAIFVLVALSSPADAGDVALLAAPLSLVGLVFATGALRGLGITAMDRRRITVTRITR